MYTISGHRLLWLKNLLILSTFLCWEKVTYMTYIAFSSYWVNATFKHFFYWFFFFLIINEWDFLVVLRLGIFSYLFGGPCKIVFPVTLIQTNYKLHIVLKLKFILSHSPIYLHLKWPCPGSLSQSITEYCCIRLIIQILCLVLSSINHFW